MKLGATEADGDGAVTSDEEPPPEVEQAMEAAHRLLAAAISEDHEMVARLREQDIDWWNVSWTLALLLSKAFQGDPISLELIADAFRDAQSPPQDVEK